MTEERSCKTCALSSYNNVDKRGCGERGYFGCIRFSKWQPIQKAPFQMTEEEAREMIKHVCIRASVNYKWIEIVDVDTTISELRKRGYIRKSPLVELVEEAEKLYGGCVFYDENSVAIQKMYSAIQALKKDHPEFTGGKK